MMKTWRFDVAMAVILFAASLGLRAALVLHYQFDGLYGQDAYAYYDYARAWLAGSPPGAFYWPLGYPALLAASFALFGTSPAVGQAVSLLLGALLSPLVYILTRQAGSRRIGAITATCLMLVCGQALQSSLVLMADIPALLWATLSAVLFCRYLRGGGRRWLLSSVLLLALACVTRWLYLALFVAWTLAVISAGKARIRWRETILAIVAAGLVFLPQIMFSLTNPYPTLNHPWVQGWSPQNAFQRDFVNIDGEFHYAKINALFYAQPVYEPYYLAPGLALFVLVGVYALLIRRYYGVAALLIGWTLLPYGFLAGVPYQNIRFPLIVVPPLLALIGVGIDALVALSHQKRPLGAWGIRAALGIALVGGMGYSLNVSHGIIDTFIANQQRDKQTAAWAADNIPAGAALYTFGLTLTLQHYTTAQVYELYYETPETLAGRWIRGQDDYLLLNVWNIENQWTGREPQIAFHWLRDQRGLIELGRYGYYTLYKVSGAPHVG